MTRQLTVGVGDVALSNQAGDRLITYSLGSCIGVAIHDPVAKVAGLLHVMLPESALNPTRARSQPAVFADTGLPILFRSAYEKGARKGRIRVVLVGGSQVMDESGRFNIGKRNYSAIRKILWRNNVLVDREEVGGNSNRTLCVEVTTGLMWIKINGTEMVKL